MAYALMLGCQFTATFGNDHHVPYIRLHICLPCKSAVWKCSTEEEWFNVMTSIGGLHEKTAAESFSHLIRRDTMHPDIVEVFSATFLLSAIMSSIPVRYLPTTEVVVDRDSKEQREKRAVFTWSWHQAFLASFGENVGDRGDAEILYHLCMIHYANINSWVPRMAAGESRVGQFHVTPWHKTFAEECLAEASQRSVGAFACFLPGKSLQCRSYCHES